MRKKWMTALALVASLCIAMGLEGCSRTDTVTAATTLHSYLPVVIGLANDASAIASTIDPAEAKAIQAVNAKIQSELGELASLSAAYIASPSSDGWTKLGTMVDELVSDADGGLLSALAIKNVESQAKAKLALSALDAAVHVLDGYVMAARTPAEVQATAAQRAVKLQSVVRYWTVQDWERVEQALNVRGEELDEVARLGI